MRLKVTLCSAALALLGSFASCGVASTDEQSMDNTDQSLDVRTQPKNVDQDADGRGTGPTYKASKTARTTPISYHKGPVMLGTTHAYYIWYGNWSGNSATTILTDFMSTLGGSKHYNINTTYYDSTNTHISNSLTLAGTTSVAYPYGTTLADAQILSVVTDALNAGKFPKDPNGVYFVLTSADVTASSGFCSKYCGWHNHATIGGIDIKYSFVGNADRCPSSCSPVTGTTPNGNLGADAMASIVAHELEETITDPDLNAWYDRSGAENGDKCAWTFGTTYTRPTAARRT